jgi:epoxyqueuosine reductase
VSATKVSLSKVIKATATQLGFELVGIAPAVTPEGIHDFFDWLERGYAGEMHYLPQRAQVYEHPQNVLDGVRSIVMLGLNYNPLESRRQADVQNSPPEGGTPTVPARVARYALGRADYHDVIRGKLKQLAEIVRRESPGCKVRGIVDTAPLLERDFARLAGLGWFGKNTMLINKRLGSWFFLAALLVDRELEYDEPHSDSHCGTCTRCLDACPTDAFVRPYVLDARRCISYLTIEHHSSIPEEFLPGMGDWLFGCDICQEVCPWNRKAPVTAEPAFQADPELDSLDALELLPLTESDFHARFGHTPLARPGRAGLARNAAVVAGNSGTKAAILSLTAAVDDSEPAVRDAAAWGLGRIRARQFTNETDGQAKEREAEAPRLPD